LYNPSLIFITGLKSAGVVENITLMVREDEFVLDVMFAMLQAGSLRSAITDRNKPA
jgi:hypothetical protein